MSDDISSNRRVTSFLEVDEMDDAFLAYVRLQLMTLLAPVAGESTQPIKFKIDFSLNDGSGTIYAFDEQNYNNFREFVVP